jgi:uncharacterized protein (TIGR03437 family)
MRGGEQLIRVPDTCSAGSLIHEIGHALGLLHEQERFDRNHSVTVLYQNIDRRFINNFDQTLSSRDLGYYDYDSIMHYGPEGFTENGQISLETVPVGIPIGQRAGLSPGDIDSILRVYGMPPTSTTVTTVPSGLAIVVDGVRTTSPRSFDWAPGSTHTIGVDLQQGDDPQHIFVRWSDGGEPTHTITASRDVTALMAVFQRRHRLSTGVASGQGAARVSPVSDDGYYASRAPVRVTATPQAGSQFVRWTGTTNLQANRLSVSAADAALEVGVPNSNFLANFTTAPLSVVDSDPPGRSVTVDNVSYLTPVRFAWAAGSSHQINLATTQTSPSGNSRYRFAEWENGSSTAARSVVAGNGPATYTARFGVEHMLTVSQSGTGTVTLSPPSGDDFFPAGSRVQVTATPLAGQTVRYWLGDLTGPELTQTIAMDRPRLVRPVFGTPLSFRTVNAASYAGTNQPLSVGTALAPLEIVTLFGGDVGPASLVTGQLDANGRLASVLGGTRVLFDGVPSPIIYASAGQTSVIVPRAIAGRASTVIAVERNGVQRGSVTVSTTPTKPAIFTADSSGRGTAAANNQDGSTHSRDNPAEAGSVIVLYATGGGVTDRNLADGEITGGDLARPQAPVAVRFGKLPGDILYAGSAPGLVHGVLQVNVRIPREVAPGDVPVQLIVGAYASPPGPTVAVR